jgi:DNA-directed RNA polymerase subunit RPC12/RpoP
MNITYACRQCDRGVRQDVLAGEPLVCPHCGEKTLPPATATDGAHIARCLVCPSTDLYARKDFPQRVGVGLVILGIVGSSIAWGYSRIYLTYGILFGFALLDLLLYWIVPNALMCYRCHAEYRQVEGLETHAAFDLETHERYRQQAARLGSTGK